MKKNQNKLKIRIRLKRMNFIGISLISQKKMCRNVILFSCSKQTPRMEGVLFMTISYVF